MPGHIVALLVLAGSMSLVFGTHEVRADDRVVENPYYFAIAGLVAINDFDSENGLTPTRLKNVDDSFGVSVWGGKRLHEYFSAELQFDWMKGFDMRLKRRRFLDPDPADLEAWLLSVNAKAYYPVGPIQPFCKVGAGVLRASLDTVHRDDLSDKPSDEDFIVRIGGGVEFHKTPLVSFTLSGEYVLPVSTLEELPFGLIELGIQRRF